MTCTACHVRIQHLSTAASARAATSQRETGRGGGGATERSLSWSKGVGVRGEEGRRKAHVFFEHLRVLVSFSDA
jgi:hypothetical protein